MGSRKVIRVRAPSANPNGIPSQSPGLRGTSYPGKTSAENHNPNGVVANIPRAPDENGMVAVCKDPQPRCGWEICFTMTQGRRGRARRTASFTAFLCT